MIATAIRVGTAKVLQVVFPRLWNPVLRGAGFADPNMMVPPYALSRFGGPRSVGWRALGEL